MKLRRFLVQGWVLLSADENYRESMKAIRINAVSEEQAKKTYARCNQIPDSLWNDGTAKPPVVIRAILER